MIWCERSSPEITVLMYEMGACFLADSTAGRGDLGLSEFFRWIAGFFWIVEQSGSGTIVPNYFGASVLA